MEADISSQAVGLASQDPKIATSKPPPVDEKRNFSKELEKIKLLVE